MNALITTASRLGFGLGLVALAAACASSGGWDAEEGDVAAEEELTLGRLEQEINDGKNHPPVVTVDCKVQTQCEECSAPGDLSFKTPCCNPYNSGCDVINKPEGFALPRPSRVPVTAPPTTTQKTQ